MYIFYSVSLAKMMSWNDKQYCYLIKNFGWIWFVLFFHNTIKLKQRLKHLGYYGLHLPYSCSAQRQNCFILKLKPC